MTPDAFKRTIRNLQVWCSSCMVAFTGADPIGVLIGAKRPSGTLIHRIAVRPDHVRQGHGRHLLTSLSSKLAILGPPRITAEVPETLLAACGLFSASGYVQAEILTDHVLEGPVLSQRGTLGPGGGFVIPVTLDDLAANGLLEDYAPTCWQRSIETLSARKDAIKGLAVASEEQIEAYLLYIEDEAEILALRSLVDDGGSRLNLLLSQVGLQTLRFPKVHPAEIPAKYLETLGFRPAGAHLLYATTAQSQ